MLYKKITNYTSGGIYPMHMPGHKRNTGLLGNGLPYGIDLTEIHGFDNLQNPCGILKDTAGLAAELYGSRQAFLLVNGSTAGILAGIGAFTSRGDTVLMARNSHISVYNAAALFGLKTSYLIPESDPLSGIDCSVNAESVRRGLSEHPDTKLVVITSPTYEGVVSDIKAIAGIVHANGAALLVDSAHGAHLGFSQNLPEGAVRSGADIIVMSLHKTLPALTQCALLHICGGRIDTNELTRLLSVFQTSSPSYVLMASIDRCLRLIGDERERLFGSYDKNLDVFGADIKELEKLSVLYHGADSPENHPGIYSFDRGKLVVSTAGTSLTGTALMDILRVKYKIELETACLDFALAITGVCDSRGGLLKLSGALLELDKSVKPDSSRTPVPSPPPPVQAMPIADALAVNKGRFIPLEEAEGSISLEYIWAYPPGRPVIVPGETVSRGISGYIMRLIESGAQVLSTRGRLPDIYAAIQA